MGLLISTDLHVGESLSFHLTHYLHQRWYADMRVDQLSAMTIFNLKWMPRPYVTLTEFVLAAKDDLNTNYGNCITLSGYATMSDLPTIEADFKKRFLKLHDNLKRTDALRLKLG